MSVLHVNSVQYGFHQYSIWAVQGCIYNRIDIYVLLVMYVNHTLSSMSYRALLANRGVLCLPHHSHP